MRTYVILSMRKEHLKKERGLIPQSKCFLREGMRGILLSLVFFNADLYGFKEEDLETLKAGRAVVAGDLSEAPLQGYKLGGIFLKSANLQGADLREVDFKDVDLYNADLRNALFSSFLEFREQYPLIGVLGRLGTFSYKDQNVDCSSLSLLDLPDVEAEIGEDLSKANPLSLSKAAYLYETYGDLEAELKAYEYYKKAAVKGVIEAKNNMAWMIENKRPALGSLPESETSLDRVRNLYETGSASHPFLAYNFTRFMAYHDKDAAAQYTLARYYELGEGIEQNTQEAFYWFLASAKNGYPKGMYTVALSFDRGIGTSKSQEQFAYWMEEAAKMGHLDAQFITGQAYQYAQGVGESLENALFWYERAAEGEHKHALLTLGNIYEQGIGIKRDPLKASDYYERASLHGSATAHYNAGRMYEYLPPIPSNQEAAVVHYQRAIALAQGEETDPPTGALFLLGTHYERGVGILKDTKRAKELYREAAAKGHDAATLKLILGEKETIKSLLREEETSIKVDLTNIQSMMDQLQANPDQPIESKEHLEEKEEQAIMNYLQRVGDHLPNLITPLAVASYKGLKDTVQSLFEGGDDINQPINTGFTPLMLASIKGHFETVKKLLSLGANPKLRANNDMGGGTAWHYARQQRYEGLADYIREFEEQEERRCLQEREINSSQEEGTSSPIQERLELLTERYDLLWQEREIEVQLKREQDYLKQDPLLKIFYHHVQNKLTDMFLAYKAIDSGLIDRSADGINTFSQGISLLGEMVPLPGVGIITKAISGGIDFVHNRGEGKKIAFISKLIFNLSTMDREVEITGRLLSYRYEEQIKQLTPKGAEVLAECAVRRMVDYLRGDKLHEEEELSTQVLKTITSFTSYQGFMPFSHKTIETKSHITVKWSDRGIFQRTGIRTIDNRLYKNSRSKIEVYGFRLGEVEEGYEEIIESVALDQRVEDTHKDMKALPSHNIEETDNQRGEETSPTLNGESKDSPKEHPSASRCRECVLL